MQTISDLQKWQALRATIPVTTTIGFVPTMGCLHAGHASLMQQAVEQNDVSVLSIFVNPTQFDNPKDLQHYPQTLDADLALAEELGIDYVLTSTEAMLYPDINVTHIVTKHPIASILEGEYRQDHFNGVLTIVMKLLNLVGATQAYFGEKDYQQYVLVKHLATSYFLPTKIISCPIIREASGLACSSRNTRLSVKERKLADKYAQLFHACDENNINTTKQQLKDLGIDVEYLIYFLDRMFIAVNIGQIRLIDNFKLHETI